MKRGAEERPSACGGRALGSAGSAGRSDGRARCASVGRDNEVLVLNGGTAVEAPNRHPSQSAATTTLCSLHFSPERHQPSAKKIRASSSGKKRRHPNPYGDVEVSSLLLSQDDSPATNLKRPNPFVRLIDNDDAFLGVLEYFVHPSAFRDGIDGGDSAGLSVNFGMRPASNGRLKYWTPLLPQKPRAPAPSPRCKG